MSGTSLDGVDAVLVDLGQPIPKLLAKTYLPFGNQLKNILLSLHTPGNNELHLALTSGNELVQIYSSTVSSLITQSNTRSNDIRAIGCHGQTIRHCPDHGYTLQIGNASLLAELTGITVISDFRSRDIAAGGQGAPLVPAFHDHVLRHKEIHRVIVNIGGISNLTNLPPGGNTTGFDCGPGNLLMDAWCTQHLNKPFDDQGTWAASGKVIPDLLERMLNEPYLSLTPPKSTGRDLFNTDWLKYKLLGNENAEDVQATLLELTCQCIAYAIQRHCAGVQEVFLCGGGSHNLALQKRLAVLLSKSRVDTTRTLGLDEDYLEATAFAWLAQQTLLGQPANLPLVTGAKHPCVLGAIYHA